MQTSSDALVFFGATGGLAHKKIFPALQRLAGRGKLEISVIGVAKSGWNLQQLEPPPGLEVETFRDERVKVLKGIRPLQPNDVVRGQVNGYRNEPGVRPDSEVETYVALRLFINSWRWKGVPFFIRAGKSLPVTASEVIVTLRQPPDTFLENPLPANYVRFQVIPELVIAIGSHVKVAGDALLGEQTELVASKSPDPHEMGAYEELLGDALSGNSSRFSREDYVEEAWRIVDPVLDSATPVYPYAPRTWGPRGGRRLNASRRVDRSQVVTVNQA